MRNQRTYRPGTFDDPKVHRQSPSETQSEPECYYCDEEGYEIAVIDGEEVYLCKEHYNKHFKNQ